MITLVGWLLGWFLLSLLALWPDGGHKTRGGTR